MQLGKIMYFWIFRGGLGEASVSKASPNEEKSINQLSKNGSTIDKGKKLCLVIC